MTHFKNVYVVDSCYFDIVLQKNKQNEAGNINVGKNRFGSGQNERFLILFRKIIHQKRM